MQIDGQFPVQAPPEALMRHLFDARLMASCLPGCESLERLDDDRYRARVLVAMAGIQARFELQVEITRREALAVWATTRGDEGGQASTLSAESEVRLEAAEGGTRVRYRSEVTLTGRLGRFALGMMKKKAQSLGDEFAARLQAALQAAEAAPAAARVVTPAPATATVDAPPAATPALPEVPPLNPGEPPRAAGADAAPPPMPAARPWWQRLRAWLRGDAAGTPTPRAGA